MGNGDFGGEKGEGIRKKEDKAERKGAGVAEKPLWTPRASKELRSEGEQRR
jgi:hypothetical protein